MRNFASKLLGEAGVRGFSFIFIFVLARKLGAAEAGRYSSIIAFVSLFTVFIELGSNLIITREIARRPGERGEIVESSHLLKFLAAAVAMAGIHALGRWSPVSRSDQPLVDALGFVVLSYTLIDYMGATLAGKEEMGWEAFLRGFCRAVIALTGVGVLIAGAALRPMAMAMSLAALFALLVGQRILSMRLGALRLRFNKKIIKRIFLGSVPLLASYVFWTLYDNQDILLMKHFHISDAQIGLFWSAAKITEVLRVIPALLVGAFFPKMARFAGARAPFVSVIRVLLGYTLVLAPLIVGAVYAAAPLIQRLLYGSEYVAAAPYLRILMAAYGATFLNHVCVQIIITQDREAHLVTATALACVSNFILTCVLIPRFGVAGVCYALVASESLCLLFLARLVIQNTRRLA